jgi:hypothetical protein
MKTVTLQRTYRPDRTLGSIISSDYEFLSNTLERPWLDNQVGISCIPEGEYEVHRDMQGRFTWFSVKDVPDRTFIEFHEGTEPYHSQGCILMNTIGLQNVLLYTEGKPFKLIIEKA